MAVSKGISVSAMFFMLFMATVVIWAFYDFMSTPQPNIMPLLVFMVYFPYIFLTKFGEWLPFLKKKNFITAGGAIGVYIGQESHDSGMVTVYFIMRKKYLEHCNFRDYSESSVIMRFFTMLSHTRVAYKTDHFTKFKDLNSFYDAPEGAIFYEGTLKKGVTVLTADESLRAELNLYRGFISDIDTIAERAKAVAEFASDQNNKDMNETATMLGNATDNISKGLKSIRPEANDGRR